MKKRDTLRIARAFLRALAQIPQIDRARAIPAMLVELRTQRLLLSPHLFLRACESVWEEVMGIQALHVVSAHRLSSELKEALVTHVPQAELHTVIDPRLIGGATVRMGNRIFDASLAGALQRMKSHLLR